MATINYQAALEAVLFASGDSIAVTRLAEILGIDHAACRQQLELLAESYRVNKRGIQLVELGDSVQLCTKEQFSDYIKRAIQSKRDTPISPVSMEVLAIIAYNQPVTKGFIEQVRGVNSAHVVNTLVEKGLVEEAGRLDVPGRPITYRTTEVFLRSFGIKSLEELPPLEEPDEQLSI